MYSKFGKRKLAPTVSPNKSVEGLYGGILTTIIVMLVVQYQYLNLTWVQQLLFLILSLITVFGSVLGDLFESMIKRRAGIKDSTVFCQVMVVYWTVLILYSQQPRFLQRECIY